MKNAWYKNWLVWALIIIVSSLSIALIYNVSSGGQVGVEHKAANRQIKTVDDVKKDSYPTMEQAKSFLKKNLGNDYNQKDVSTIRKTLNKKWNPNEVDAIMQGIIISQDMTPRQAEYEEIEIARNDPKNESYVGLSKDQYRSSIYSNKIKHTNGKYSFSTPGLAYDNGKIKWNQVDDYSVSQPFLLIKPSNDNDQNVTGLIFLQVPFDKKIEKQDLTAFIKDRLPLSVNDKDQSFDKDGLSMISISVSNFKKSNEIFPGSIVPISYSVNIDDLGHDDTARFTIPAIGSYDLSPVESLTAKF